MHLPTRKPTLSEYAVLVLLVAAILIILGAIGLVVAFRAPAAKHELAVALVHRASWSLGVGVALAVALWLFRRFAA
jgi:Trk-type K+ transport system membrane component